jgi:hypothetical protein
MTASFDEFMRQYRMIGSDKADGYSRDAFMGLDDHEKGTVFELLENKLPFSAEWLAFLDRDRAIAVFKNKEPEMRKDPYRHAFLLQAELVRHGGSLEYQGHMIDDYPNYADHLKPSVISAIGRTRQNRQTIAFFKSVVLTEADGQAAARAARELLSALKIPRTTVAEEEMRRRLMDELRSDDRQVRLRALGYLERYE